MVEKIITHLGNFDSYSNFFLDANNLDDILEIINEEESPIKIYNNCDFNGVLAIRRKENHLDLLMNVMTAKDRKKIEENLDFFIEGTEETKNGIWLYDLENDIEIYDYQTRKVGTKTVWNFYSKKLFGNHLAIDSEHKFPIKLYNSTNRTSLFWGIYLINRYMSNPMGNLADEYGVEVALKFVNKIYNLEHFSQFYINKLKILEGVQIWEKDDDSIVDRKYMTAFNKIYKQNIEDDEEIIDPKKVEEEKDVCLTLSKNGEVFLSDVLSFGLLDDFFPICIDIIVDPRIVTAYMEGGKLILVTSVELEDRAKEETKSFMKKIEDDIEFKRASEVTTMLSISEQLMWKNIVDTKFTKIC